MKHRRALIFSVVCGFVAVLLAWYYVSEQESRFQKKFEEVRVLVATKDIPRYQIIDETMLSVRGVPKPFVQPKALTREDAPKLLGYVAEVTILAGEQITETKVSHPGESRVSIAIPKNERACSIAVDEISGVAGLIRPGDHVDIVGTFKTVEPKTRVATEAESVTLFQNIPVLAVGRDYMMHAVPAGDSGKGLVPAAARGDAGFSNVTVSATARQCMELAVVQQVGVITLTMRSYFNRAGGDTFAELKEKRSTAAQVSGIQAPLEISRRPKWLEMRGEQTVFAP